MSRHYSIPAAKRPRTVRKPRKRVLLGLLGRLAMNPPVGEEFTIVRELRRRRKARAERTGAR